MTRNLARLSLALCILAILLLGVSFGGGPSSPMRVLLDLLFIGALGLNAYCAFKWLRALRISGQKAVLIALGAGWFLILSGLLWAIAVVGFSSGAGGGSDSRPPGAAEWLLSLAAWGVGAAFHGALRRLAAADCGTPRAPI